MKIRDPIVLRLVTLPENFYPLSMIYFPSEPKSLKKIEQVFLKKKKKKKKKKKSQNICLQDSFKTSPAEPC